MVMLQMLKCRWVRMKLRGTGLKFLSARRRPLMLRPRRPSSVKETAFLARRVYLKMLPLSSWTPAPTLADSWFMKQSRAETNQSIKSVIGLILREEKECRGERSRDLWEEVPCEDGEEAGLPGGRVDLRVSLRVVIKLVTQEREGGLCQERERGRWTCRSALYARGSFCLAWMRRPSCWPAVLSAPRSRREVSIAPAASGGSRSGPRERERWIGLVVAAAE